MIVEHWSHSSKNFERIKMPVLQNLIIQQPQILLSTWTKAINYSAAGLLSSNHVFYWLKTNIHQPQKITTYDA